MRDRLTSDMLVGALKRRVESAGGFATVLKKGDPISGVILVQAVDRGVHQGLFERMADFSGGYTLLQCGPEKEADAQAVSAYMVGRRRSDPDLWIIELDIPEAERFAAETICG